MNCITVKTNIISDRRIEYDFAIAGEWTKYFTDKKFWVEYSSPLCNLNGSIAIIPVLGTLLPVSWIFDAKIIIEEIDEDFCNAIPEFKKGYVNMYPQIDFNGELCANRIVKNNHCGNRKTAALFSGGADAFNTLLSHIGEKPDLITIWGADISAENNDGWSVVEKHRDDVLDLFGLDGVTVKSSFKKSINEALLSDFTLRTVNDNWWHGFHHALGMFALSAPIAFAKGYSEIYVASSFTPADAGKVTCASDPTIDNFVRFCGCRMVHDGYEFNRQDKIHNICEYANKNNIKIPLRVCWESSGGSNCCVCEKCVRTMLAIYAEKNNPTDFGFSKWDEVKGKTENIIRNNIFSGAMNNRQLYTRYDTINKKIKKEYTKQEIDNDLMWFYKSDTNAIFRKFIRGSKLKRKIASVVPKPLKRLYKRMRGSGK